LKEKIMTKKYRKRFTTDQRDKAIDEYVSGAKTAQEVAQELGTDVANVYRWKTVREEKAKGSRIDELIGEGNTLAQAKRILELEAEMEEYKKKVAEQSIIIDLLKKLQTSNSSAPESELTGLIKITRKLDQKRRPAK
jgi:transposase-like protein